MSKLVYMCFFVGMGVSASVLPTPQSSKIETVSPKLIETIRAINGDVVAKIYYKQQTSLPLSYKPFPPLDFEQADKFVQHFSNASVFTLMQAFGIPVVDEYLQSLKLQQNTRLCFVFPDEQQSFAVKLVFKKPQPQTVISKAEGAWVKIVIYATTNTAPLHAREFAKISVRSALPFMLASLGIGTYVAYSGWRFLSSFLSKKTRVNPLWKDKEESFKPQTEDDSRRRADLFFQKVSKKHLDSSGMVSGHVHIHVDEQSDEATLASIKTRMSDPTCTLLVVSILLNGFSNLTPEKLIEQVSSLELGTSYQGQKRIFYVDGTVSVLFQERGFNAHKTGFGLKKYAKNLFSNRWLFVLIGEPQLLDSDVFPDSFRIAKNPLSVWPAQGGEKMSDQMLPYIRVKARESYYMLPGISRNLSCSSSSALVKGNVVVAPNDSRSSLEFLFGKELESAWDAAKEKLWNKSFSLSNAIFLPILSATETCVSSDSPSVDSTGEVSMVLNGRRKGYWIHEKMFAFTTQGFLTHLIFCVKKEFLYNFGAPRDEYWPPIEINWISHVKASTLYLKNDRKELQEAFFAFDPRASLTIHDVDNFLKVWKKSTCSSTIVVIDVKDFIWELLEARLAEWNTKCNDKNIEMILINTYSLTNPHPKFSHISSFEGVDGDVFVQRYLANKSSWFGNGIQMSEGLKNWLEVHLEK